MPSAYNPAIFRCMISDDPNTAEFDRFRKEIVDPIVEKLRCQGKSFDEIEELIYKALGQVMFDLDKEGRFKKEQA